MIHLIVGNTGSGKTTYSTELKKQTNGIIFSIDKWNKTLFLADKKPNDGLEWFLERIDRAEEMIMELVQQLENSNTDSILDLGLSKFEHREKFRKFAKSNGFKMKTHFLAISKPIFPIPKIPSVRLFKSIPRCFVGSKKPQSPSMIRL